MTFQRLPAGYRYAFGIDFARNRRQLKLVCLASLSVTAAMAAIGLLWQPAYISWRYMLQNGWMFPALAAAYCAYIALHELTHGALMRLLSGQRPKYGFQLCYAYAGSDVWFDKPSHNVIALAPLLLWGAVCAALERTLPSGWFWFVYLIQISNVSGSVGDVYCVWRLFRLPKDALIQDSGVRMRVFARRIPTEEQK